jgi:hypothetical protein
MLSQRRSIYLVFFLLAVFGIASPAKLDAQTELFAKPSVVQI